MNKVFLNIIRIAIIIILQVLVFKNLNLNFGDWNYIHVFLYPVIIFLIPLRTPQAVLLTIAFVVGLTLDMFYDSVGVHASACVFIAFVRNFLLKLIEPVEGYNIDQNFTLQRMGLGWMTTYVSSMLFLFLCWYFSVEAFSFIFIKEIVFRVILSFVASLFFAILFIAIFNPKE